MNELPKELAHDIDTSVSEPRTWWQTIAAVAWQALRDLFVDSGTQWAAAIAYYSLLSVFPLLLAGAAIAAYFVDPQSAVTQATQLLGAFVPRGIAKVETVVRGAIAQRERIGVLSLGALLWSGSRVFGVVTKALNIAYDVDETYGFLQRTLIELIMVVTIGILFIVALASRFLLGLLRNTLKILPAERGLLFGAIELVAPAALLLITFFLVYRFVPRGRQRRSLSATRNAHPTARSRRSV